MGGEGVFVCTAEQEGGDGGKSLLVGGLKKAQRREMFQQAKLRAAVEERPQTKGRCGSGKVGPDPHILGGLAGLTGLTTHPVFLKTQRGGLHLCYNALLRSSMQVSAPTSPFQMPELTAQFNVGHYPLLVTFYHIAMFYVPCKTQKYLDPCIC